LLWILYFQTIELPPLLGGFIPGFEISMLLIPLVSASTLLYASELVDKLTEGRLTKPVSDGLKDNGLTVALFLVSQWPHMPEYLVGVLTLPFLVTLTSTFLNILEVFFRNYRDLSGPIIRGLKIAITGLLVSKAYMTTLTELRSASIGGELGPIIDTALFSPIADSLGNIFKFSVILTMLASFTGVLRDHTNPYISYLGSYLGKDLLRKFLALVLLGSYFSFIRGILTGVMGEQRRFLALMEWAVVCLFFYHGYRSANTYAEIFVDKQELALKWTKHTQDIKYTKDQKLEQLSKLIEQYVKKGDKNLLSLTLSNMMSNLGYTPENIHAALKDLLEYEDIETGPIAFNWQIDYIKNKNIQNRRNTIASTLENLKAKGLVSRGEPLESIEDIEVMEQ
jgi:hypothetical protein